MLWIISGPSSVGKTHFIRSARCAELTGLSSDSAILSPSQVERGMTASGDALYHYNILRPSNKEAGQASSNGLLKSSTLDRLVRRARRRLGLQGAPRQRKPDTGPFQPSRFDLDPAWNKLARLPGEKTAIVLVARKRTLMQRVANRDLIGERGAGARYPAERFLDLYANVDLVSVYQAWCRELEKQGIPYILVSADEGGYPVLDKSFAFDAPDYALESTYPRQHIVDMLEREKFVYHRVNLPYGLHTGGDDRRATRRAIFPLSLVGKSVLDIGCGIGYYCFEAEKRGASRVVGTELKADRFKQANQLREINESRVEFIMRDVGQEPLDEQFDIVLLLNVIHHLIDPIQMIRALAPITREKLVIEFSTFTDPTIKRSVSTLLPGLLNKMPLIGVGEMSAPDPTFVFSPPALTRMLTAHDGLFARIEMLKSPLPGRMIAICHKTA